MPGGIALREIIELHAQGKSIHHIAKLTGQSRNGIHEYLRNPGLPVALARPMRGSALGYPGGHTTLKNYLHPHRI